MAFDWTITLGDVLKTVGALGAAGTVFLCWYTAWVKMQGRVDAVEKWIEEHQKCSDAQIQVLNEIREVLAYIRGQISGRKQRSAR